MGMETQYAMGMGSHACVSSGPAGGGLCSFFPFASSLPLSSLLPSLTVLTDLSPLAALSGARFGASQ